jgi:hypothetical protein
MAKSNNKKNKSSITGSGGIQSKKSSLKLVIPIVVIVALVGGFFVYKSNAATNSISAKNMSGGYDTSKKGYGSYRLLTPNDATVIATGLASPSKGHYACVSWANGSKVRRLDIRYSVGTRVEPYTGSTLTANGQPGEVCAWAGAGNPGTGTVTVTQIGDGATYIDRVYIK